MIETVRWRDGVVRMIDQTRLPEEEHILSLTDVPAVHEAIRSLRVRGAPAIGIAAAYGVVLAASNASPAGAREAAAAAIQTLKTARPTAVNLFWALDRMADRLARVPAGQGVAEPLRAEADRILEEDLAMSRAMGAHGAALLPSPCRLMTHCNTGGLATGGLGTALGVVYEAARLGKRPTVIANETRPLLQGGRLTAWELLKAGIPVRVSPDGAAAWALKTQSIDAVLIGSDRIAANGDVANKIGSYAVALGARAAGVPFYVVAPGTTIDPDCPSGADIPIEERAPEEVTHVRETAVAPEGADAYNPAFDVTPAELVSAIITEQGVFRPPFEGLAAAAAAKHAIGS